MAQVPKLTSLCKFIQACKFQNIPQMGGGGEDCSSRVSAVLRDLVKLCCWGKASVH